MTFTEAKKKRRATSTLEKNRDEAIRLVLYLCGFKNNESDEKKAAMRALVHPELLEAMEETSASLPGNITKYKKQESFRKTARLWWQQDPRPPINLAELPAEYFASYLSNQLKHNGAPLEPKCYQNKMSNLNNFYKKYKVTKTVEFAEQTTEYMDGLVRIVAKAKQNGIGKIDSGKREISFELYEKLAQWFIELGDDTGIFGRAFLVLTWNLMCQGSSTDGVCIKHLKWQEDCSGISFSHVKNDQTGSRNWKPRHIYANPSNYFVCCLTALTEYFLVCPDILLDENGHIFVGPDQEERFSDVLARVKEKHWEEIKAMGYEWDDIGVHSIQKGAGRYASSGTTAAPGAVSVNNRGGWLLGGVRDVYLLYERAGDQYVGRILSGLDVLSPDFACSAPDFLASIENMTVQEANTLQRELDEKVGEAMASCFGAMEGELISARKFLRHGLASVLHHLDDIKDSHPPSSPLLHSELFRDASVPVLKSTVKVIYPWKDNSRIVKLTGLPPHVIQLALSIEIKQMVAGLQGEILEGVERLMDDRTMGGTLSETRMRAMFEQSQHELMEQMRPYLRARDLSDTTGWGAGGTNSGGLLAEGDTCRRWFHQDGQYRRVPPNWEFPTRMSIAVVYRLWHTNNDYSGMCPLKKLTPLDVNYLKSGSKRLEELRFLMMKLDRAAASKSLMPNDGNMTAVACNTILPNVIGSLQVPLSTPTGRTRHLSRLKWPTIIQLMPALARKRQTTVDMEMLIGVHGGSSEEGGSSEGGGNSIHESIFGDSSGSGFDESSEEAT